MTHRGDMSEEGVQFLIGIEDAVLARKAVSYGRMGSARHVAQLNLVSMPGPANGQGPAPGNGKVDI